MGVIRMEFAFRKGGGGEEISEEPYTTGQTFVKGAVLKRVSGEVVIATVSETGAVIVGVALNAAATKPGYDAANSPTVITGRVQKVGVSLASRNAVFKATLVNNSDTPVACTNANIGVSYGFRIVSTFWAIDKNITATNDGATIVGYDPTDPTIVYFTFNAADSAQ